MHCVKAEYFMTRNTLNYLSGNTINLYRMLEKQTCPVFSNFLWALLSVPYIFLFFLFFFLARNPRRPRDAVSELSRVFYHDIHKYASVLSWCARKVVCVLKVAFHDQWHAYQQEKRWENPFFSPKVKQDPTHRTATWVKWLRTIFSLCATVVFIIWGAGGGCPSSL